MINRRKQTIVEHPIADARRNGAAQPVRDRSSSARMHVAVSPADTRQESMKMVDEAIEFQTVCKQGDIPEGEGRAFPLNGTLVAVFLRDGNYFAINDSCPHMGASLASGYLEGHDVLCPWHAWKFCIKDGLWMDNPRSKIKSETYAVRVVGDEVQVQIPQPKQPANPP
ncbi:Rieske (2Fe-2S) protein [Schlesneria paludicola]|uniref:Rieske (2Fe-2S) protein n=1 Tax=Schlesneria paludicola TaxID=360056 RepID=UPI00029A4683|nr:Rieske (2Fe-2S) protein [Schlesneria paludicola]